MTSNAASGQEARFSVVNLIGSDTRRELWREVNKNARLGPIAAEVGRGNVVRNKKHRNHIRDLWDRLSNKPFGKATFSKIVAKMVPYTGSISADVLEVGHTRALIAMKDRRRLRNHLRSVHAIALANLAEYAGNLALVYTMPDDARFIVSKIEVEYLKKSRGTITAEGVCPDIRSSERCEYDVNVTLRDSSGDEVCRAIMKSLVGPKK